MIWLSLSYSVMLIHFSCSPSPRCGSSSSSASPRLHLRTLPLSIPLAQPRPRRIIPYHRSHLFRARRPRNHSHSRPSLVERPPVSSGQEDCRHLQVWPWRVNGRKRVGSDDFYNEFLERVGGREICSCSLAMSHTSCFISLLFRLTFFHPFATRSLSDMCTYLPHSYSH